MDGDRNRFGCCFVFYFGISNLDILVQWIRRRTKPLRYARIETIVEEKYNRIIYILPPLFIYNNMQQTVVYYYVPYLFISKYNVVINCIRTQCIEVYSYKVY